MPDSLNVKLYQHTLGSNYVSVSLKIILNYIEVAIVLVIEALDLDPPTQYDDN